MTSMRAVRQRRQAVLPIIKPQRMRRGVLELLCRHTLCVLLLVAAALSAAPVYASPRDAAKADTFAPTTVHATAAQSIADPAPSSAVSKSPASRFFIAMPAASDPAPTTDAARFRVWQQQARAVYRAALLWPNLPKVQAQLLRSEQVSATAVTPPQTMTSNAPVSASAYGEMPLRKTAEITADVTAKASAKGTAAAGVVRELYQLQLTEHSRTNAYLLRPPQVRAGVLLLHDHGAFFAIGKEKWLAAPPQALAQRSSATSPSHTPSSVHTPSSAHTPSPADTASSADTATHSNTPESPWPAALRWQAKYFDGHAIADELAAQGYLVLVADSVGFGEHGQLQYAEQQQLAAHLLATGHSLAGLAAVEDLQLAAFLRSQLGADKPLISLGFSMGAFRAWQVAALSDEVDASAAICWFGRWQDMVQVGSNLDKGQTAFYFLHPGLNARYDIPDLVSMAAPKPLYLINGGQDALMPVDGVLHGYRQLQQVWRLLGAEAQLRTELWSEAGHRFSAAQQQQVWQWLHEISETSKSETPLSETSGSTTHRPGPHQSATPKAITPTPQPRE